MRSGPPATRLVVDPGCGRPGPVFSTAAPDLSSRLPDSRPRIGSSSPARETVPGHRFPANIGSRVRPARRPSHPAIEPQCASRSNTARCETTSLKPSVWRPASPTVTLTPTSSWCRHLAVASRWSPTAGSFSRRRNCDAFRAPRRSCGRWPSRFRLVHVGNGRAVEHVRRTRGVREPSRNPSMAGGEPRRRLPDRVRLEGRGTGTARCR